MTAAYTPALESNEVSYMALSQAMHRAQDSAYATITFYVMGCGVFISATLMALFYSLRYGSFWQWPISWQTIACAAVASLTVLWCVLGAKVVRKKNRISQAWIERYEVHMQHIHAEHMHYVERSKNLAGLHNSTRPTVGTNIAAYIASVTHDAGVAMSAAPNPALRTAAPPRIESVHDLIRACLPANLPVSIFGAYLASTRDGKPQKNSY